METSAELIYATRNLQRGEAAHLMQQEAERLLTQQLAANPTTGSGSGLLDANFVDDETPAGLINGSNVTYTLANTPTAGTVKLYQNGVRLRPTTDFSVSSATITMVAAPATGEWLRAEYRKP